MALAYGMGAAVAVGSIMSKWFIHHRAKAISLSSTGVSLGGATLVPLGTWLIGEGGLRLGAPVLGALVVVVALPVLWLAVVADPAGDGPAGRRPRRTRRRPARAPLAGAARHAVPDLDPRARPGARRRSGPSSSASRWPSRPRPAVLIHQLSFLQDPDKLGSRSSAALAVTVTTIGSIIARLVVGQFIADKADKRVMTVVLFVGQATAVLLYTMVSGTVAIYVVALLFGFTIGNVYMMMSLLTAEIFGILSFGTVYGVISLGGQLGSGVGLVFIGWAHDVTDGYTVPFVVLAGAQPGRRGDHHVRPAGAQPDHHRADGDRDGGAPGRMTGHQFVAGPQGTCTGSWVTTANEVARPRLGLTHHHVGNTSEQLSATNPRSCDLANPAPMQKCGPPPPKPTCGFLDRDRSKSCGRSEHPVSFTVPRAVEEAHLVALRDLLASQLGIDDRGPRELHHRRAVPPTNSSTAAMIRPSKSSDGHALAGVAVKGDGRQRRRVPRRVVAGHGEQHHERPDVVVGQPLAGNLGVHQIGEEVVARVGAAVLGELGAERRTDGRARP